MHLYELSRIVVIASVSSRTAVQESERSIYQFINAANNRLHCKYFGNLFELLLIS